MSLRKFSEVIFVNLNATFLALSYATSYIRDTYTSRAFFLVITAVKFVLGHLIK